LNTIKEKIVLVTGSTDGIGKQTAFELAEMGAKVIIHGRDSIRTKSVYEEIKNKTGNNSIDYFIADFSSLKEVKTLSHDIHRKYKKLDVLLNNAGVFETERVLSKDGFEQTFAVNHLPHFLLTALLLDLIKKLDYGRIINVASTTHASELDFDNLQGEKYYDGCTAYSYSKLCNIIFTYYLSQKLSGTNITTNCLHPGVIGTKLLRAGWGIGGGSLKEGCRTSVYLATSPEVENISGKYFVNSRQADSSTISYDKQVQKRLWDLSEEYVQSNYNI